MISVLLGAALAAVSVAAAQAPTAARVADPGPAPQWAEVRGSGPSRVFVDRNSIRFQGGSIRYIGRILYPRPDENGVVELLHLGEIGCARRDFRIIGMDILGAEGRLVHSETMPADQAPVPINSGSSNEALHTEFCR